MKNERRAGEGGHYGIEPWRGVVRRVRRTYGAYMATFGGWLEDLHGEGVV